MIRNGRTDDGEEGESATFPQTASLFSRKIQRGEGTQNPQMMTTPMLTWNPEWNQTTHLDSGGAGKANVLASANSKPSSLWPSEVSLRIWTALSNILRLGPHTLPSLISYVKDDQMRKR